jgi:hypothetical protein
MNIHRDNACISYKNKTQFYVFFQKIIMAYNCIFKLVLHVIQTVLRNILPFVSTWIHPGFRWGEVSVSYINHFNVHNMRQTIKLTPLFYNLLPSLLYIRILSIHFFSKFPKNWWFTKIKETPLFRSVEYNIYSGNDSFESVKKRFLSEGESMMFEQYYHDCENM